MRFFKLINLWPPYLGSGIRVRRTSKDFRTIEVEMKMRPWNRNYVGTHYGGSLYSMCDPFYMLMLMHALGRDYVVWDKAATIRFRKPGRGVVHAIFHLAPERLAEIRAAADAGSKADPVFDVVVRDEQDEVVAEVKKVLYVRRKTKAT